MPYHQLAGQHTVADPARYPYGGHQPAVAPGIVPLPSHFAGRQAQPGSTEADAPPRRKLGTGAKVLLALSTFAVLVLIMALPSVIVNTKIDQIDATFDMPVLAPDAPKPDPDDDYRWESIEPEVATDAKAAPSQNPVPTVDMLLTGASFEDENAFAASFEPYTSDDGAYGEAATELADSYGVTLNWDITAMSEAGCVPMTEEHLKTVVAAVCASDLTTIYVNTVRDDFQLWYQVPAFIDVIKLELSRIQIGKICDGETSPDVARRPEAVASSYAINYLGAIPENLTNERSEYDVAQDSNQDAAAIYAGTCS